DALEGVAALPADAHLTWQLLKSQLLITTGDYETSHQLAKQVWKASQERGQPLQAVDACLVMAEAFVEGGDFKASLAAIAHGEEALTTLTEEPSATTTQRQASLLHLRGKNGVYEGDFNQALDYFQQSLTLRQELGNKYDIAVSLRHIGVCQGIKGDEEQALELHQQALQVFQELGAKSRAAHCLTNIGVYYQMKGEWERALEYTQQGLALFQELGNKKMIGYAQGGIGDISYSKGALEQALEYFQLHLAVAEELGDKWNLAGSLGRIASVYLQWGDLDQALVYNQKTLALAHELDNKDKIAWSLAFNGKIHWQKDALDQALASLKESIKYRQELGRNLPYVANLFWLIRVAIDIGSHEQAQDYLRRLQEINEQEANKIISQYYRTAKALVLQRSPRLRDKGQAQALFQQVAKAEGIRDELTVIVMMNLCELLLDELKAYGDPEVFQEAQTLVDRLYALAQEQHSFSLAVDVLILQAKFALIKGDLAAATQLLEQAKLKADEKSLKLLAKKAAAENQLMETQFETWRDLIQRNASFEERLEQARLTDYLNRAMKFVAVEMREPSS
ncbi:MAG: tetratricopeptide repeat protein, partial [Candidatus Heimdallarchaeota archaeon]